VLFCPFYDVTPSRYRCFRAAGPCDPSCPPPGLAPLLTGWVCLCEHSGPSYTEAWFVSGCEERCGARYIARYAGANQRQHSAQGGCYMAVERLTIGQVAARYDVSTDVVRRRIRRGLLPAQRDNHGQWWVELDADAPPPATLAAPRPLQSASLAPTLAPTLAPGWRAMQPPPPAPTHVEWTELRERLAAAEGEARGLREALHVAQGAVAEATRRAESAERAAVEAWERVADLAGRFAAVQPLTVPVGALPPLPRRKGFLARLLGR